MDHSFACRLGTRCARILAALCSATIAASPLASPGLTNAPEGLTLQELRERVIRESIYTARVEGVALWVSPGRDRIVLQDSSAALLMEVAPASQGISPGDRLSLQGACAMTSSGDAIAWGTAIGREKQNPKAQYGNAAPANTSQPRGAAQLEVLGRGILPEPVPIRPGQPIAGVQDWIWAEATGEVTFAGRTSDAWHIELQSGSERLAIRVGDLPPDFADLLPGSTLRALGVARTGVVEEKRVPIVLEVQSDQHLQLRTLEWKKWTSVAQRTIADVLGLPYERDVVVRIHGQVRSNLLNGWIIAGDVTGEVEVETVLPADAHLNAPREFLGRRHQTGTRVVIQQAVSREATSATPAPTPMPSVLTSVEQIDQLPREEAARKLPVKVRGVITAVLPGGEDAILHDSVRGIVVMGLASRLGAQPLPGDLFEIEGKTAFGRLAPIVDPHQVTRLGHAPLPAPAQPTSAQLMNGVMDAQFVEMRGVVAAVDEEGLILRIPNGRIRLQPDGLSREALLRYEHALVRIRGTLSARWEEDTRRLRTGELQVHNPAFHVEKNAPEDLFALPRTRAENLHLPRRGDSLQPVRVSGQVIHRRNGEFRLMDGEIGLRFIPQQGKSINIGDLVDVVGFPDIEREAPVIPDAVVRKTGHAALPEPKLLSEKLPPGNDFDSTLVAVEGKLLRQRARGLEHMLEIQCGSQVYVALLHTNQGGLPAMKASSRVRVQGVYIGRGESRLGVHRPNGLLLGSCSDVTVLTSAPGTAPRHAMAAGLALAVVAVPLLVAWRRKRPPETVPSPGERSPRQKEPTWVSPRT